MASNYHTFHIPVMGTGHSIDTPIRVAPLGITSVISIIDDILIERIRRYYSEEYSLPYSRIPKNAEDSRAKRITAYLETVREIVRIKMEAIRKQPFFENNDKSKYFELLPDESLLKRLYDQLLSMRAGPERDALAEELTSKMQPGSIDVNIMVKVDRTNYDSAGNALGDEFSDAMAALRGYANSSLRSAIVFSAGINQGLFNYMTQFRDFYRDKTGEVKKKIILKVSDFRSARIQGKFLARKGLEVHEFRIESGLNCGGHAFASNGHLLPTLLQEFKEKREQLVKQFQPLIQKYYERMGWEYPEVALNDQPLITVQGGIGAHGEVRRLREDFGMDMTGWASPFLLVPEATCVDDSTRELLRQAGEDDLYLSNASPFGIPFNNVRRSGSEIWTRNRVEEGRPGSACPKSFLVSNTEFTDKPICLAAREYQELKLEEIGNGVVSDADKERLIEDVVVKVCLCDHLGNGAQITLGIAKEGRAPQAICPGPNIAWFDRYYTLKEMVDHIYGRGPALVPVERPHMFAKEIVMYVDYFEERVARCGYTSVEISSLRKFRNNLENGMDFCLAVSERQPYPGENLASISACVEQQKARLMSISANFEEKAEYHVRV